MKKNSIKAFTLVEMLIVIVIIGILIAALMPRMQAAQWRARDVSRKTALSQIQTAIVTYQWDNWRWPQLTWWLAWTGVQSISEELRSAWMNSIPDDPIKSKFQWLWSNSVTFDWQYWYLVATRNWVPEWWFALMAKTEVEWWSNWVVCSGASWTPGTGQWWINSGVDLTKLTLCEHFEHTWADNTCVSNTWTCKYADESMLRYIVIY